MKVTLIFFSQGEKYKSAGYRLLQQAKECLFFDKVIYINEDNQPHHFKNFLKEHESFFKNNLRGFGYWLWKPYLIQWYLNNELESEDILVYLDVGCELSKYGINKFNEYLKFVKEKGALFFSTGHKEISWTKADLFEKTHFSKFVKGYQIQATFSLLKNSAKERNFANQWYEISKEENYHFIDDSPSILKNHPQFKEHRHDQSILSLLCHKDGYPVLKTNCMFYPILYYKNSYVLSYPIHANRNISNTSKINDLINSSKNIEITKLWQLVKYLSLSFFFFIKIILFKSYNNIYKKWM